MNTPVTRCLLALPLLLLAACVPYDEGRNGYLGSTVQSNLRQQLADPQRAANPGHAVPSDGLYGPLGEQVMQGYRGETGEAAQVGTEILINVGD